MGVEGPRGTPGVRVRNKVHPVQVSSVGAATSWMLINVGERHEQSSVFI